MSHENPVYALRLSAVAEWLKKNDMELQGCVLQSHFHNDDFINVEFLKRYLGVDVVIKMDAELSLFEN